MHRSLPIVFITAFIASSAAAELNPLLSKAELAQARGAVDKLVKSVEAAPLDGQATHAVRLARAVLSGEGARGSWGGRIGPADKTGFRSMNLMIGSGRDFNDVRISMNMKTGEIRSASFDMHKDGFYFLVGDREAPLSTHMSIEAKKGLVLVNYAEKVRNSDNIMGGYSTKSKTFTLKRKNGTLIPKKKSIGARLRAFAKRPMLRMKQSGKPRLFKKKSARTARRSSK